MSMMKVPTNKQIAAAAKRKVKPGDLLDKATHYQANCGLPIRKMNLKTGENKVFEYFQQRPLKPKDKK